MSNQKNNLENFDCVAAAERMHEFLDGELERDLRVAMERHLASCADCAKTLAQLRQIENAHRQIDAQLALPPEDYWQALPPKVLERVKTSERRRLLALPKLPRFKSAAGRVPVAKAPPARELLHLPPAVRKFLRGPARYALPLAAAAAFGFLVIRELREKPAAPVMTESAPATAAQAERDESRIASAPRMVSEAPAKKPAAGSNAPLINLGEAKVYPQDSLLAISEQGAGGGRGADLASATASRQSSEVAAPSVANIKAEEPQRLAAPGLATSAQPSEAKTEPEAPPAPAMSESKPSVESSKKAKDQPAANAAQTTPAGAALSVNTQEIKARPESIQAETSRAFDARLAPSVPPSAPKPSAEGRMGVSALSKRATFNPEASRFSETVQQAQQTSDLKKREKLWRDFLETNPDSAYRVLAISNLAQTLAAASDSTTKLEQLEKNLAYFQDHAATLRPLIGAKEFERELARLQRLVNHRNSSPKP